MAVGLGPVVAWAASADLGLVAVGAAAMGLVLAAGLGLVAAIGNRNFSCRIQILYLKFLDHSFVTKGA